MIKEVTISHAYLLATKHSTTVRQRLPSRPSNLSSTMRRMASCEELALPRKSRSFITLQPFRKTSPLGVRHWARQRKCSRLGLMDQAGLIFTAREARDPTKKSFLSVSSAISRRRQLSSQELHLPTGRATLDAPSTKLISRTMQWRGRVFRELVALNKTRCKCGPSIIASPSQTISLALSSMNLQTRWLELGTVSARRDQYHETAACVSKAKLNSNQQGE